MGRSDLPAEVLEPLEQLARGVRAALGGEGERALELLEGIDGLGPQLERRRLGARFMAAGFLSLEAQRSELESMSAWAEASARNQASWKGWMGTHLNRSERFDEAAALHEAAARAKEDEGGKLASMLNGATALMDGLRLEEALPLAQEALQRARSCRHASYEAMATWILRSCRYRGGGALQADTGIVDAAALLGGWTAGVLAMTEAAVAWRGREETAPNLARRAAHLCRKRGLREAALLMEALAWSLVHGVDADAHEIERNAAQLTPSLRAQVLALLGRQQQASELARALDDSRSAIPMEVLSVDEIGGHPIRWR